MSPIEILKAARNLFVQQPQRARNKYQSVVDGIACYCAAGAVITVATGASPLSCDQLRDSSEGEKAMIALGMAAAEITGRPIAGWSSFDAIDHIAQVNDHMPDETAIEMFDAAIAKLETAS